MLCVLAMPAVRASAFAATGGEAFAAATRGLPAAVVTPNAVAVPAAPVNAVAAIGRVRLAVARARIAVVIAIVVRAVAAPADVLAAIGRAAFVTAVRTAIAIAARVRPAVRVDVSAVIGRLRFWAIVKAGRTIATAISNAIAGPAANADARAATGGVLLVTAPANSVRVIPASAGPVAPVNVPAANGGARLAAVVRRIANVTKATRKRARAGPAVRAIAFAATGICTFAARRPNTVHAMNRLSRRTGFRLTN